MYMCTYILLAEATAHSFDSNTVVTYTLSEAYKRDVLLARISSARRRRAVDDYSLSLHVRTADVTSQLLYAVTGGQFLNLTVSTLVLCTSTL